MKKICKYWHIVPDEISFVNVVAVLFVCFFFFPSISEYVFTNTILLFYEISSWLCAKIYKPRKVESRFKNIQSLNCCRIVVVSNNTRRIARSCPLSENWQWTCRVDGIHNGSHVYTYNNNYWEWCIVSLFIFLFQFREISTFLTIRILLINTPFFSYQIAFLLAFPPICTGYLPVYFFSTNILSTDINF